VPESHYLYSEGELTPSSEGNSFFKEGGNAEEKEPSSFKGTGISSIVSLLPSKLVSNGEQIVNNVPKKRRVREPGMIHDLNPRRPESEVEPVHLETKFKPEAVKKQPIKLTD